MNLDQFLGFLRKQQGARTQKAFADFLGVSAAYLNDVYLRRRDPGEKILVPLGLERIVLFKAKKGAKNGR